MLDEREENNKPNLKNKAKDSDEKKQEKLVKN